MSKPKIAILLSRLRVEEKLLFEAFRARGIEFDRIDDRELVLDLHNPGPLKDYDVVVERCINHSRALYTLKIFKAWGIKTVNQYDTARICGDKLVTNVKLVEAGVPTPGIKIAYTADSALEAIEQVGYPAVLKPCVGSWGRLISKVNDREAAEAILEHKEILGSYHHSTFYIQEYIDKKEGRDIRAFVIGDETIAAIYRKSPHWITNTARGGEASKCEVTPELNEICVKAAKACGGGIVAIDVFESDRGLLVCEVNYTMEYRNSIDTTGVNIPDKMVEYILDVAQNG